MSPVILEWTPSWTLLAALLLGVYGPKLARMLVRRRV